MPVPVQKQPHTYPGFLWMCCRIAFKGGAGFYAWMILLTAIGLVGLHAYGTQLIEGMAVTNMSDHVSWGLYIANFTFGGPKNDVLFILGDTKIWQAKVATRGV